MSLIRNNWMLLAINGDLLTRLANNPVGLGYWKWMKNGPHDEEDIEEQLNCRGIAYDTGPQIHLYRM